eukprot:CAMPEP_0113668324 /NCGR_PEP_ID=MMETSP0038_2-20120614/3935_1 /TAXON_ID=2898 /ORGANISM="Cryptomonas paramecium" /LENGTH=66 /DNA_ID=CAMNT_0000584051 /DNA_START=232 /DNA_END=432 /DNA_ORIENTATION=+ /assembly_acc=CAM_ASM_000170
MAKSSSSMNFQRYDCIQFKSKPSGHSIGAMPPFDAELNAAKARMPTAWANILKGGPSAAHAVLRVG